MAIEKADLINIQEASKWASSHLGRKVSTSNISYLVQYGRIRKYGENGSTFISKGDLLNYYKAYNESRESSWREQLGQDLNWVLSFEKYTEAETTKHVHRLHPYKGKFIPQLVEYFLDSHTDKFKTESFFHQGDIVLDPFSGSGTTLVQANELGLNAIGIDVSAFNVLISSCKVMNYDLLDVQKEINRISLALRCFLTDSHIMEFEEKLLSELSKFNSINFPVPEYKYRLHHNEIDEKSYGAAKELEFNSIYQKLIEEYNIKLRQDSSDSFLDKWFSQQIREELDFVYNELQKIQNTNTKKIIGVILSRTMRSCRATMHADLATLTEPVTSTYYCAKHGKICKPLFSILKWWNTYTKDTLKRLVQFDKLRTNTHQVCITGDSRNVDILAKVSSINPAFAELIAKDKIKGIFSSPPYVGLIDYHEQHAYAYDLFGFERKDELEIGPLYKGQGKEAKQSYVQGIADVLNNCKRFFCEDYNVFLVANDKYGLYPKIAELAGMRIVNQYKRPVLNRTEKDKSAYSEVIFHLKDINYER
ncbi:MAG: DNA methyltransferase [Candidatus Cloacimonetes bacterium]|nr:DNA methyltransferase [Candidatus Cloacimonadota bacterium]